MIAIAYKLRLCRLQLFCSFETLEEKMRAMANLRYRVLPPQLLLKWPKEASFCQLMMHPVPDTRPKMRCDNRVACFTAFCFFACQNTWV